MQLHSVANEFEYFIKKCTIFLSEFYQTFRFVRPKKINVLFQETSGFF